MLVLEVINMNHQKEDVLPKADLIWPEILVNLAGMDDTLLDHRKEHPCPICGGSTRFRYRSNGSKLDRPFFCNNCGSRNGLEMFIEYTGLEYPDAINKIGDYVGNITTEKLEVKKREFEIKSRFPAWYKFDSAVFDYINQSCVMIGEFQRVSLFRDMLVNGRESAIPLLDKTLKAVDFVSVDSCGRYKTTQGNSIIPNGFFSVFGNEIGQGSYITVSPLVAAQAALFTQKQVICCYHIENLFDVANIFYERSTKSNFELPPVIIVTDLTEVTEASELNYNQLIFNSETKMVNSRVYSPYEIIKERELK